MNNLQLTTIELSKAYFNFSAGHFTIFSETHREKMHGHNFTVHAALLAAVSENGMAFDYVIYKNRIQAICKTIDGYFLLPGKSPYFKIEEEGDYYYGYFNQQKLPFLKNDVLILPLRNITIEELATWFLEQLIQDTKELDIHQIYGITIKVSSGPGQCADAKWERK